VYGIGNNNDEATGTASANTRNDRWGLETMELSEDVEEYDFESN
jgi:hypothetical protein